MVALHPTTGQLAAGGAQRHFLPVRDGRAEVFIARSPGAERLAPEAFMLALVGVNGRAETAAPALARQWGDRPVEVWALNYPGYGDSSGPARIASIVPAATAAYDALQQRAGDRPIFVSGDSFGAMVALHLAASRPVAGLILRDPLPLRELLLQRWGWPNLWLVTAPLAWQIPDELDARDNAAKVRVPAVFLMSRDDHVVPPQLQQQVAAAYAGRKQEVCLQGGHCQTISPTDAQDVQMAMDWLWQRSPVPHDSDAVVSLLDSAPAAAPPPGR